MTSNNLNKLKHISSKQLLDEISNRIEKGIINLGQITKILAKYETTKTMTSKLKDYSTEELHRELLGRLKCQFNREGCTKVAEDWIIKPFNYQKDPACLPCKWKVVAEVEEKIKKRKLSK